LIGLACGLLLAGYLVVRLLAPTDERRIVRLIEQGRRGVVHRDIEPVMSVVDQDYQDDFGMDYSRLERWFRIQFRTYDSIVCQIPRLRVAVGKSNAVCSLTVWWAGYVRGRRLPAGDFDWPDGSPVYSGDLVVTLHKYETGWLVTRASP
jgi:hypothetical protein